jgi:hypothetical protein
MLKNKLKKPNRKRADEILEQIAYRVIFNRVSLLSKIKISASAKIIF